MEIHDPMPILESENGLLYALFKKPKIQCGTICGNSELNGHIKGKNMDCFLITEVNPCYLS